MMKILDLSMRSVGRNNMKYFDDLVTDYINGMYESQYDNDFQPTAKQIEEASLIEGKESDLPLPKDDNIPW